MSGKNQLHPVAIERWVVRGHLGRRGATSLPADGALGDRRPTLDVAAQRPYLSIGALGDRRPTLDVAAQRPYLSIGALGDRRPTYLPIGASPYLA